VKRSKATTITVVSVQAATKASDCHDPDFSKIKISSCIHGILHFKIFSKVLSLIPSKNMVSNASSQILDTKEFSERKYFTNEPHCYGAILYSSLDVFLLKTK
jgi:hypothetical protein